MLASIVARSLGTALRRGVPVIAAWLLAGIVAAPLLVLLAWIQSTLLGSSLAALVDGTPTGLDVARLASLGVPVLALQVAIQAWPLLVAIRAASGSHRLGPSMTGAIAPSLRSLPLHALVAVSCVLAIAIHPFALAPLGVVLLVPTMLAFSSLALEPDSWGLSAFLRLGLARTFRNAGATFGVLLVLLFAAALAGATWAAATWAVAGSVPTDLAAGTDVALTGTFLAWIAGAVIAFVPLLVLWPSLIVTTWRVVREGPTERRRDPEDAAHVATDEISPAVRQLLGTPAIRSQRLVVPPRADQPGRIPGPGVLQVAGVDLPPGRHTRAVHQATLELDARDATPGDDPARDDRLWIASRADVDAASTWKRLAAGFAETGLWPLLVPAATDPASHEWFDGSATEPVPRADIDPARALAARLASSLAGSPLASTSLLAASDVAGGTLTRGSGRRADALARAAAAVGPARIALSPGRRPADVITQLAWPGADSVGIDRDELAELLASWEARWGALLVALEPGALTFAVLRPPASFAEAVEALAEQHALCPDEAHGWRDDEHAAKLLVDEPVWRLSWQ